MRAAAKPEEFAAFCNLRPGRENEIGQSSIDKKEKTAAAVSIGGNQQTVLHIGPNFFIRAVALGRKRHILIPHLEEPGDSRRGDT